MIKVLFGSQTGNSKDYAEKLYFQISNYLDHINVSLNELNEFSFINCNTNDVILILCSTTGQGDPPDNMNLFWKQIMNKNYPRIHSKFSIFGLGDSGYTQYNFVAKKLYRRLIQLGASSLTNLGLGDEQNQFGIEEGYFKWLKDLESVLNNIFKASFDFCNKQCTFPKVYNIDRLDNNLFELTLPNDLCKIKVSKCEKVTSDDHFQETKLIKFEKKLIYNIGDVLVIYPKNSIENCDLFFKLTNINANDIIQIRSIDKYFKLPKLIENSICSINDLISLVFDFNMVPNKSFFEKLLTFSNDSREKERLKELVDMKNLDELYEYCFTPKRTIIEVLQDFSKTTESIDIDGWINIIPIIRPREYSIASSYKLDPEINILVANVQYKTKIKRLRKGLCSQYLCNLKSNDEVIATVKKGTLNFKVNEDKPVILISTGTGIAALRGFIKEMRCQIQLILFFGCRFEKKDFYFSSEYREYMNENNLQFQLISAFSRENQKYVQHKLKEYSALLYDLLVHKGASIILTGRALDMPNDVFESLVSILESEGKLSNKEAREYLLKMQRNRTYQLETWD